MDGAVAVKAASSSTVEVTVADLETVLLDKSSKKIMAEFEQLI